MARSRDVFKKDRLALRDIVQVWIISLLVSLVPLGILLGLAPSVGTTPDALFGLVAGTIIIVTVDLALLLAATVRHLINL